MMAVFEENMLWKIQEVANKKNEALPIFTKIVYVSMTDNSKKIMALIYNSYSFDQKIEDQVQGINDFEGYSNQYKIETF